MKVETTRRGFEIIKFEDGNGESCSLQASSAWREEALCWLGCNDIRLKVFVPHESWKEFTDEEAMKILGGERADSIIANTRMHLTQSQVKELLPHLIKFAETGEF